MNLQNAQHLKIREEGNKLYRSIDENLSPVLRESRLLKCVSLYQNAINTANNDDELSSSYKNMSNTTFYLTKFYMKERPDKKKVIYYIKETVKGFSKAIETGKHSKSKDWIDYIKSKSKNCILQYVQVVSSNETTQVFVEKLTELKEIAPEHTKAHIDFKICQRYFHDSVKYLADDYLLSLRSIKECYFYHEECKRFINWHKKSTRTYRHEEYLLDEDVLNELIQDVWVQECVAEGVKQKNIADFYYHRAINYREEINMEDIWDIVDYYRDAIIKSQGKDVELEAECLSKIGTIYEKILLMKKLAKKCYYKCMELAESMKPKLFNSCGWYIKCVNAIERFQREVVNEEDKKKEKEKKSVLHKIEKDLINIKSKFGSVSGWEFLKFLYKEYPPKNDEHTFNSKLLEQNELKKAHKIALTHYHPDKNSKYGPEWFFTSEEISKCLSNYYENLKSSD